jgi:hypothetical protein
MKSGYFDLQRLSDAVQISRNEYKVVFFFRSPLKVTDLWHFIANFPNNKGIDPLYDTFTHDELQNYDVNRIHVIGSTTEKNSIYTPNLDLWRGCDLICLVFEK